MLNASGDLSLSAGKYPARSKFSYSLQKKWRSPNSGTAKQISMSERERAMQLYQPRRSIRSQERTEDAGRGSDWIDDLAEGS